MPEHQPSKGRVSWEELPLQDLQAKEFALERYRSEDQLTKKGTLRLPRLLQIKWWVEMDSNQRKLTLADLQSAPFSHSGIYPFRLSRGRMYGEPRRT